MTERKQDLLERLNRGEISATAAIQMLAEGNGGESESEEQIPVGVEERPVENGPIVTRQERLQAVAERAGGLAPEQMFSLAPERPTWPWPERSWQWFWQNVEHPLHVDQPFELGAGCQVQAVVYGGEMQVRGSGRTALDLGAAVFDLRIGREEEVLRLAASTGALELAVPAQVAELSLQALPGDVLVQDLMVRRLRLAGESGALRCRRLQANVAAELRGCDADLQGIAGDIEVRVQRGRIDVREIAAAQVELVADQGISLVLGRIDSGHYRCEALGGDVELSLDADSACELSVEVGEGGAVCPTSLPWTELAERSTQRLRGKLGGGGAVVEVVAREGRVYITGR